MIILRPGDDDQGVGGDVGTNLDAGLGFPGVSNLGSQASLGM